MESGIISKEKSNVAAFLAMWVMAALLVISILQMSQTVKLMQKLTTLSGRVAVAVEAEQAGKQNIEAVNEAEEILKDLSDGRFVSRSMKTTGYKAQITELNRAFRVIKERVDPNSAWRRQLSSVKDDGIDVMGVRFQSHLDLLAENIMLYNREQFIRSVIVTVWFAVLVCGLIIWYSMRSRRRAQQIYYTDSLTGIGNQTAFEKRAEQMRTRAVSAMQIVYINIVNFKYINDTYGYDTGNELLKTIAKALAEGCEEGEFCARLTADHFAIMMRERKHSIDELTVRLYAAVREMLSTNIFDAMSLVFGVYRVTYNKESAHSMMDKADVALRETKSRKGSNVVFYDDELMQQLKLESRQAGRAKAALAEGEFNIYLQPKFNLFTLELDGAEALVRWSSKEFGFMSPDSFIPLFERNGFITELDFYVLETICTRIKTIMEERDGWICPVAVNVSRATLFQEDFIEHFVGVVDKYNVPHGLIEVEVTESVFMMRPESVVVILDCIRQMGFRISMDDFGSGYSSLGLLSTLPIDTLKIDRSFLVAREVGNIKSGGVIKCIVELSQVLNMQVVCEGIESDEQLKFLQQVGCHVGQGYYFARPMPLIEFYKKYDSSVESVITK